jgi:hypothetical protein
MARVSRRCSLQHKDQTIIGLTNTFFQVNILVPVFSFLLLVDQGEVGFKKLNFHARNHVFYVLLVRRGWSLQLVEQGEIELNKSSFPR